MKGLWIAVIVISSIFIMVPSVFAEENLSSATYIWVPENTLTGETYEGAVILDNASDFGQIIILSTNDPTILKIPESVTINPYSNHGLFQITPLKEGEVEIFAVVDGTVISTKTTVFSSSRQPEGLKIVLPTNKTKTDMMLGYVLSVDGKGSPAPVKKDTTINLSATPMIDFESNKLEIKTGNYYAKFIAKIKGSGKIFAYSESLAVGEIPITRVQESVTVRVAVAPNIIKEQSKAYFFVWLEKDGKPYAPPYVVHAFLSSSNLDSIRFNENPVIKQYTDSILKISLVDGVGNGYLISQNPGNSIITVSVDGIGSAQTNVIVGPVLLDENFQVVEVGSDDKLSQINSKKPNIAFVWFYPKVTAYKAYGVIALYNMNVTQDVTTSVSTNSTSVDVSNKINRVVPVPIDGRIVTLTSESGISYPSTLALTESNEISSQRGIGSTSAAQFEVKGINQGNYTVSVSGPGLERYQSDLIVSAPFQNTYKLKITPIPFVAGQKKDLALISVVDDSDSLVDPQKIFAGTFRGTAFTNNEQSDFSVSSLNSAVYSAELNEITRLSIFASNMAPVEQKISPSGIASSVMLDLPSKIHISEPFPYAIHEVDSYGIPIRKLNSTGLSATPGVLSDGVRLKIDNIGKESLAAVTKVGAESKTIETFSNSINFGVIPSGVTNRVDKEFELKLDSSVKDFDVVIDSPIPYKKIDDLTYVVIPDKEGYFNITFTALKKGYTPSTSSFSVLSQKFVNFVIKAIGSDGAELNINQQIQLGNVSRSIVTPFIEETRPKFVNIQTPIDIVFGNKGYKLNNVVFADQRVNNGIIENLFLNKNTEVVAHFDRMIRINAENAEGGGYYPYGEQVELKVFPKDKVLFLIRDVFDHWDGLNQTSDHVVFAATSDIDAKAVLKEDYTFLSLIIAISVSVFFYMNFRRKGLDVKYYFDKSKVMDMIKRIRPRKKIPQTEKESVSSDTEF